MLQRAWKRTTRPQPLFVTPKSDIFPFIWTRWSHLNGSVLLGFKVSVWGVGLDICCRCSVGNTDATPEMVDSFPHRREKNRQRSEVKSPHVSWSDMQPKFKFPNIWRPFKTKLHKTKWGDKIPPLGTQVKVIKITLLPLQIQYSYNKLAEDYTVK